MRQTKYARCEHERRRYALLRQFNQVEALSIVYICSNFTFLCSHPLAGRSTQRAREAPVISGGKAKYKVGDWISLNCSTSADDVHLKWYINGNDVRMPERAAKRGLATVDNGRAFTFAVISCAADSVNRFLFLFAYRYAVSRAYFIFHDDTAGSFFGPLARAQAAKNTCLSFTLLIRS